jgi:hypothetical protein
MYVLYYNLFEDEKYVYFKDINLPEFLNYFKEAEAEIIKLYAYDDKKNYYESNMPQFLPVVKLIEISKSLKPFILNLLFVKIRMLNIEITDESEYLIKGNNPTLREFMNTFIKELVGFDLGSAINIDLHNQKYVLFDTEKIVAIFSTFDEYLTSNFSK